MRHGGNLEDARARYGDPAGGWLDLSTGINPNPYPLPSIPSEAWTRLPDGDREAALVATARRTYGVAEQNSLVAAPGTQALIQLAARLAAGRTVGIVSPTYSEHAIAARREGSPVIALTEPVDDPRCDVVVVVTPNNPDCRRFARHDLHTLAASLAARGGHLIVDEAFADADPSGSVSADPDLGGMLVLRSFGKFFGLAGVRLGFAIGPAVLVEPIAGWLGPWAVPGPAIEVGIAALADVDWCRATRADIAQRCDRLCRLLGAHGLEVVGRAGLFALTAHRRAGIIHAGLARSGILTRRFDDHPNWLRFGLATDAGLDRLDKALGVVMRDLG